MTMKGKQILFTALLMTLPLSIEAQKKKTIVKSKVKAKPTVVDKELEQKLESMRNATQKVMFFDSVVVSKAKLMQSINLPEEAGSVIGYNSFFKTNDQPNSVVNLNQLKNKCIFSKLTNNIWGLYYSERIGGKWSNPMPLKGLESVGKDVEMNWPFLLADGTTLYFAAKGEESIGGFDIFMSRFDESTGKYLKPENIGMPFNSTANDYFYILDEFDGIGWFATDRNQPNDKVCIYSFIINDIRENYNVDNYSPEQLNQLSQLHSISQTWTSGAQRKEALAKIQEIARRKNIKAQQKGFDFVINDKLTYSKMSDFRSKEAADKYVQLKEMLAKKAKLDNSIDRARSAYPTANAKHKEQYKTQLLTAEKQSEKYELEISSLKKDIRSLELKKLGN